MPCRLSRNEAALLAACAALLALALFGPAVTMPAAYHAFADQRAIGAVPQAMDVLSNLPFALAGLLGIVMLRRLPGAAIGNVECAMLVLFFAGLVMTSAGSSFYHLRPDDAGLAVDRCGMSFAFAGLLGAAAVRVSGRVGVMLAIAVVLAGPFTAHHAFVSGNALPWAVVQFGGGALLVALAVLPASARTLSVRWGWVIAAYALAKVLELHDHDIYEWTGHWLSGHTLKHIAAAMSACPVLAALGAQRESGQNRPATTEGAAPGMGNACTPPQRRSA
jgi:hypothetical protein